MTWSRKAASSSLSWRKRNSHDLSDARTGGRGRTAPRAAERAGGGAVQRCQDARRVQMPLLSLHCAISSSIDRAAQPSKWVASCLITTAMKRSRLSRGATISSTPSGITVWVTPPVLSPSLKSRRSDRLGERAYAGTVGRFRLLLVRWLHHIEHQLHLGEMCFRGVCEPIPTARCRLGGIVT